MHRHFLRSGCIHPSRMPIYAAHGAQAQGSTNRAEATIDLPRVFSIEYKPYPRSFPYNRRYHEPFTWKSDHPPPPPSSPRILARVSKKKKKKKKLFASARIYSRQSIQPLSHCRSLSLSLISSFISAIHGSLQPWKKTEIELRIFSA